MEIRQKYCFKLLAKKLQYEKNRVDVDRVMLVVDDELVRHDLKREQNEGDMREVTLLLRIHDDRFGPNYYHEDGDNAHVLEERLSYLTWETEELARLRAQLTHRENIGLDETDRVNAALVDVNQKIAALSENEGAEVVERWKIEFQMHVDIVYGY
jgi:hypothetical protein